MFMLIIKIFSSQNSQTNVYVSNEEILLKRFQYALSEIHSDIEEMESEIDKLIRDKTKDYEKTMTKIYSNTFKSINLTGIDHSIRDTLLTEMFRTIFFNKFLLIYDEYSYSINFKIMELYTTHIHHVQRELNYEADPKYLAIPEQWNFYDNNFLNYLNFEYFLITLEKKLTEKFDIPICLLRKLVYSFLPQNNNLNTEQILQFYQAVSSVRKLHCNVDPQLNNSLIQLAECDEYSIIKYAMSRYTTFLLPDITKLYEFHKSILKKGHVSKIRFSGSKNICETFGLEYAPLHFNFDNLYTYFGESEHGMAEKTKSHVFDYIVYLSDKNNIYETHLQCMKKLILWFHDKAYGCCVPNHFDIPN